MHATSRVCVNVLDGFEWERGRLARNGLRMRASRPRSQAGLIVGPDLGPRRAWLCGNEAAPGVTKVTPYINKSGRPAFRWIRVIREIRG